MGGRLEARPRPSVLIVEEIENGLDPWTLEFVFQALRDASTEADGTQVIVTTHSPFLLDHVRGLELLLRRLVLVLLLLDQVDQPLGHLFVKRWPAAGTIVRRAAGQARARSNAVKVPLSASAGQLDYDLAIPNTLLHYFPTGVLGLGLTALLLSACATTQQEATLVGMGLLQ